MRIQIINGPNLNLLGIREPEIYGKRAWEDYLKELRSRFPKVRIDYYQSNLEGEIIDKIQEVGFDRDGIVLNAGAYTHTSVATICRCCRCSLNWSGCEPLCRQPLPAQYPGCSSRRCRYRLKGAI